ncbi:MAG: fluoride efflux transporter CrcB [Thermomonas sp.]|nr:MAG: fluoride efflux transporter CrcB [Thermomonas sp.]
MTSWSQQLLLVMLGGALGAGGRYWLGSALLRQFGNGIPWGTLAANLIGSFLAGFLVVWLENRGHAALYWRAFLIVGVMGGLTTFSALMVETLLLARSQRSDFLLGYLGGTLVAGFILVWAGARLAALVRTPY